MFKSKNFKKNKFFKIHEFLKKNNSIMKQYFYKIQIFKNKKKETVKKNKQITYFAHFTHFGSLNWIQRVISNKERVKKVNWETMNEIKNIFYNELKIVKKTIRKKRRRYRKLNPHKFKFRKK